MQQFVRFTLRIPHDLHDALRAIAEREERSLHAQIIYVLRRYAEDQGEQVSKAAARTSHAAANARRAEPPVSKEHRTMAALPIAQPRAAIYVRVSDPKQEANYSLPTQEAACRAYATEQGFSLADDQVYREVHTATELWQRPTLARVRDAMHRRLFDVLICYGPDRFSRNQIHTALLLDMCERAGVELRFANFDFTQDATGRFLLNARAFAAEMEVEKIKERTMRGLGGRLEAGKLKPGGSALYGYR